MQTVTIYTDGACSGNPGSGGYGVVLISTNERKELAGGFRLTTSNRMEIMAAIVALQSVESSSVVHLYSDSKYLVDAIAFGWAKKWKANGWRRNQKERALNPDLWQQLLDLCSLHQVKFFWLPRESNPEHYCCDQLARSAACRYDLPADTVYEKQIAAQA